MAVGMLRIPVWNRPIAQTMLKASRLAIRATAEIKRYRISRIFRRDTRLPIVAPEQICTKVFSSAGKNVQPGKSSVQAVTPIIEPETIGAGACIRSKSRAPASAANMVNASLSMADTAAPPSPKQHTHNIYQAIRCEAGSVSPFYGETIKRMIELFLFGVFDAFPQRICGGENKDNEYNQNDNQACRAGKQEPQAAIAQLEAAQVILFHHIAQNQGQHQGKERKLCLRQEIAKNPKPMISATSKRLLLML